MLTELTSKSHNYHTDKLSSYKRLRGGVEFVETIPKSASGKILRRLLRNREYQRSKSAEKSKL